MIEPDLTPNRIFTTKHVGSKTFIDHRNTGSIRAVIEAA